MTGWEYSKSPLGPMGASQVCVSGNSYGLGGWVDLGEQVGLVDNRVLCGVEVVSSACRRLSNWPEIGAAMGGGMGAWVVPLGLRPRGWVTGWKNNDSPLGSIGASRVCVSGSSCSLGAVGRLRGTE